MLPDCMLHSQLRHARGTACWACRLTLTFSKAALHISPAYVLDGLHLPG